MGTLISEEHAQRVTGSIDDGRTSAELVLGGNRVAVDGRGAYVEPTIFDRVDEGARLIRDEIFGPVLCVTTFDDEEEALRIANDTRYGLVRRRQAVRQRRRPLAALPRQVHGTQDDLDQLRRRRAEAGR